MSSVPAVMVSSTCYDLRQVRADLASAIEALGYVPLLSELPSFPIAPEKSTVDNCREQVANRADILVLVIGGRYGSIPPLRDRSITNIEYAAARAKGIPVYAFVDANVLALLPLWNASPQNDFSAAVDTPKLFQFIQDVRAVDSVWMFEFRSAADIVKTLRVQFAALFKSTLDLRQRVLNSSQQSLIFRLSPASATIVLEKPVQWEYLLYFQNWCDAVEQRADLLARYDARMQHGDSEAVVDVLSWVEKKFHELQCIIDSANRLLSPQTQALAFGPDGTPGDADLIAQQSARFGELLEHAVKWSMNIDRAFVPEEFRGLRRILARAADRLIERLRRFPVESLAAVRKALSASDADPGVLSLTIVFEFNGEEDLYMELERLKKRLG